MEDTQALHHQQQLEQQQQAEEKPTNEDFDRIAYRCLGVAQAMRDCRQAGFDGRFESMEARLIELVNEYDELYKRRFA